MALMSAQHTNAAPPAEEDDHEDDHGSFTAVVEADPEGNTSFVFAVSPTSQPPMDPSFTLIDDGTDSDTHMVQLRREKSYTFSMNLPEDWMLDDVSCEVMDDNGGGHQVSGAAATIDYKEGEHYTCTWMVRQKMPSISLGKSADPLTYSAADEAIAYTYEITNTGNVTLGPDQFEISDDMIDGGTAFDCGADDATLDPDETLTCEMEYLVTADDVAAGSVTNTAMAMLGDLESEDATATVTYVAPPTTTVAETTTTVAEATTTTVAETTTTVAETTTTIAPATTVAPTTTVTAQSLIPDSIDLIVSGALPVLLPQSTIVATTAAPATTTAVTITAQALPSTGDDTGWAVGLAGIVLAAGSALVGIVGRRRYINID